ncbi:MAG: ATP-dependent ligase LigD phosphoesterase module / ATP-dependent ligase LigD polymerase [Bacteroidetes bacterium]|nr:ATP-dependent ligase LigD phosphoesterase module / ATP-dependent ligase LigD polymerase [Bacteroidota bacterium]
MSLTAYNKKRNFKDTPEPSGKSAKSKSGLRFVIQRHKASHLHYDFRLEVNGVLKSWAVPKGPSLNPADKRLAMMVEDHPYNYRTFTGVIPEGNYGAGIVEIWDEGEFSDIDNSEKKEAEKKLRAGLHAGNLKFRLHGKKLKGEFALVKLKGKQENAWLLIKHNDQYAVQEQYNSEEHTPKNSPINKWLLKNNKSAPKPKSKNKVTKPTRSAEEDEEGDRAAKPKKHRQYPAKGTRKLDDYIVPMLAGETDRPFDDKGWIYEIKWDGYRAIAEINQDDVLLYSRNGNVFNSTYPLVVDALKEINIPAILDGEVVIVDENGKSDFQLLQHYLNDSDHEIKYCVFDILSINGESTCDLPLITRKKLLKQLVSSLKKNSVILYSDHIKEKGKQFFETALRSDLEGIIAKKANSLYVPGLRTTDWLKIKHHKTLEAIIAGYTEPTGSRKHFGALILGVYDNGKLRYVGHTGSGFTSINLAGMNKMLQPLIQKESPFDERISTNMPATWVKPVLVCEIKYTEWTNDGHLRHPIFLRLRDDKKAKEVTMKAIKPVKKAVRKNAAKTVTVKKKTVQKTELENEKTISSGKIKVKTTNLNKVFFPDDNVTKGDVINYYISISKYILPFLKDRPQSLKRNPNGIKDNGFFHKDAGDEAPGWVKSKKIFSESANKDIDYILCNNQATLTYLNNLGCIEINPWHSTIQKLNNPDYLIIDIDPSDKNTFEQVIETANVIHELFKKAGIESYCKTSGATGIHVYVPAQKKYTYDQLKDFAHLICMMAQEQLPGFTSLERNLKKRGNKMIYLDHLQNRKGQTISCVYSLRPKEGATVSMPLEWKEMKYGLRPQDFNIFNALKRIEKKPDLFAPVLGKGLDLQKSLRLLDK